LRKRPEQIAFARQLRRKQTDAERALWGRLRDRQLEDMKLRRQQPIGPYIVDFVNFERKLVIELDGGQHNKEEMRKRDRMRAMWLKEMGYQVLRFWNNELKLCEKTPSDTETTEISRIYKK